MRFMIVKCNDGWRWFLFGANGSPVGNSHGAYTTKSGARRALRNIGRAFGFDADVWTYD